MKLNEIKIYRITHIKNIPHILQYGITHVDSCNNNPNYTNIGDMSLIDTRKNKEVIVDNGDMDSQESVIITLGDFIPFYFGIRMPMLYVAQIGGNFVEKATPAEKIIYMVCSVSSIIKILTEYYFSDGHATDSLTTFYDKKMINELPNIIDWKSVTAQYWGGSDNLNTKRKKQAEFLVPDDLPYNLIGGLGCYNEKAKDNLIKLGVEENKIKIIPQAYY